MCIARPSPSSIARTRTLANLLPIARSFELADCQALEIEQKFESSTHLNSIDRQRDHGVILRSVKIMIGRNLFATVVETKGIVRTNPIVLPSTKLVDAVARPVILLGSVAKRQESPRILGKMLDSLNNPTTNHLKTTVCLLSRPITFTITRTAFIR